MATRMEKAGSLPLGRGGAEGLPAQKPKGHEELGLCVAFVVLLAIALFVGLRGVDWSSVGHAFTSLMAWIV